MSTALPMTMIPLDDERVETATIQPIKFWTKYKEQPDPAKPGMTKLLAEEWVEWAKKGVSIPFTVVDAVKRVKKDKSLWAAIEPFYENWRKGGGEEMITGTPLAVWPGVTADVVDALRAFRIVSVEDLSMISDAVMQKVPNPNMPMLRERARKFLATKDIAEAVTALTSRDQEVAILREQVAAMQKALADANLKQEDAAAELAKHNPEVKLRRRAAA